MKDNTGTKVPTVSSAQCRFVATIPVGPLFNHPTTYSPVSTVAVSDSLLMTRPLKFGTTPKMNQGSSHEKSKTIAYAQDGSKRKKKGNNIQAPN